ncbi:translation factor SUA5 [Candidatus Koribacter versatilis Ellin345]|uniref:Threonylcarbamoyl-AMP synthase n=1 Tax=Koribacter versatilis (strain Ellin345) TaxID=204669 RepID=Q1IJ58_KORVE|nr:L-threonylcarbamoyladenylate synthase [Candidatus Koribacter versatilis]ABF43092.1 translation factor SUA5 [Candidatus Koribacter versatilis Ellin345]
MTDPAEIQAAARLLKAGRLVSFPTETVYGLGANALDAEAVARIYAAKGRPATSPLIVHVDSVEMAKSLVTAWPDAADALARAFWPGPLTLVLPARDVVPPIVRAGLPTVGVRMPDHPLAQALIRAAGVPLAAPSANRFTQISPTTAEHVRRSLGDSVEMVLDGGPCAVGIESTVLSLAGPRAVLLRPGGVTRAQIEAVIGPIGDADEAPEGAHPSPGMHPRHYSPRTRLLLVKDGEVPRDGRGIYLSYGRKSPPYAARRMGHPNLTVVEMPASAEKYAARLYDELHRADDGGFDWIAVEQVPETPEWEGVRDRVKRAAVRE